MMLFAHLFFTLASPKLLPFGNEKKNKFSFCISLTYSFTLASPKLLSFGKVQINFAFRSLILTLASPKLLSFGNEKKNKFSFCISLTYS